MWLSEARITRRVALLGVISGLSACGFVPAFGTNGASDVLIGTVEVIVPPTIAGYRLADRVRDRLGPPDGQALYRLDVTLDIREIGTAITQEGAVTRFTLEGVAAFRLIRREDDTVLVSGETDSSTGYSTTDSTVSTENARANAEERLAGILADQIIARLQIGLA